MINLKFVQTKQIAVYRGPYFTLNDGETVEVDEKEADRLQKDFPKNFQPVKIKTRKDD